MSIYRDEGSIPIDGADEANVPVNIWLIRCEEGGGWELTADNYMPRKGRLLGYGSYRAWAAERSVLAELVRKHWLPLYEVALARMAVLSDPNVTEDADLYYWQALEARP